MKLNFLLTLIISILFMSCGKVTVTKEPQGGLTQPCYDNGTCNEGLTCVSEVCVDLTELEDDENNTNDQAEDFDETEDNPDPDIYIEPDDDPAPVVDEDPGNNDDECDTENIGKNCSLDNQCGDCNICIKGKCSKGCESDDDCQMYVGLKCNKKLNRCTNVYASLQACGEIKCPTGCCYAEEGMTSVKCLTTPEAATCGLCANGEIYIPSQSMCIPAVCSTSTNNCPTLNAGSTDPDPECFECRSGEFICTERSNCSSVVIINSAKCKPAGQKCSPGLMSNCCSGMPCVDGYCY